MNKCRTQNRKATKKQRDRETKAPHSAVDERGEMVPSAAGREPQVTGDKKLSAEAKVTVENGSAVFFVKAHPAAKRIEITGVIDGALKVSVTAPPDKGKANQAIISLLAEKLGLPTSALRVVSGAASRNKKIATAGIGADELRKRLRELVGLH